MKKRKAPITLISIFIVCGVTAIIMNLIQLNPNPHPHREVSDLALPGMKDAAPPKTTFRSAAQDADKTMVPKAGPTVTLKPQSKTPLSAGAPKPRPGENDIAGQWYAPEHAKDPLAGH